MCKAFEETRAEGRAEGAELMGHLITTLLSQRRQEDIPLVAADPDYREKLFQEFQLI